MTTSQRLDLLSRTHQDLFPRAELQRLVQTELGHLDALDRWVCYDGRHVRARAPHLIYHICAGNLPVSAWTSLMHGLLLGARNVVKLPSDRDDSSASREILHFIRRLSPPLRRLVKTSRKLEATLFAQADVIVAFGSDSTMKNLRAQIRWNQKFIAHGHALSLLWIEHPARLTSKQVNACAIDILTYDQLGCLSPQAIYFPEGNDPVALGAQLADALEGQWIRLNPKPARGLAITARINEARDLAYALGHRVWLPPQKHFGWTLIFDSDPTFQPSPLHGVIYLRQASVSQLERALDPLRGRISTVGLTEKTSSRLQDLFLSLGVSRFCAAGRMQFPSFTWHHDGRPALGDLVSWIDSEPLAP
jgi:hypothetical protein